MTHYFYIAQCADSTLYCGTCIDLIKRARKHNDGTGAKYTRQRRPITFVYTESFNTLSEARKRESEVKKWTRKRKQILLETKEPSTHA